MKQLIFIIIIIVRFSITPTIASTPHPSCGFSAFDAEATPQDSIPTSTAPTQPHHHTRTTIMLFPDGTAQIMYMENGKVITKQLNREEASRYYRQMQTNKAYVDSKKKKK